MISSSLSKDPELGRNKCSCCRHKEFPGTDGGSSLGGFVLPPNWELLYQTLPLRKRVCVALGFGVPKEENSTNNATAAGLTHAITEYQCKLDLLQNGVGALDFDSARAAALEHMSEFVYDGRQLGTARYSKEAKTMWMCCGLLEGEESVPEGQQRHYCGKWFHFQCIGLISKPKEKATPDRVACMMCLQDRRFRVKVLPAERLRQLALHDAAGTPRIVSTKEDERIPTWSLTCDCAAPTGNGLPCAGQCAVARTNAVVISFESYNPYWFGGHLKAVPAIKAAFVANNKHIIDVEEVLTGHQTTRAQKPSTLEVQGPAGCDLNPIIAATSSAVAPESDHELEGAETGNPVHHRKKSRRYKAQKTKVKNSK